MGLGQSGMGKVGGVVERERVLCVCLERGLLNRDRTTRIRKGKAEKKRSV